MKAEPATKFWSLLRYLSSFLTRTIGDEDVRLPSGNFANFLVSCSTWYLQHGSNCHETPYKAAQKKLIPPQTKLMGSLRALGKTHGLTKQPSPAITAVLCKQFPTWIHLAVSSPIAVGSMAIILHWFSNARSRSASNCSCASSES